MANRLSNFTYTTSENKTERIPVIFRFFHESQGDWYWWGSGNNSATAASNAGEPTCKTEHYQRVWYNTQNYFSDLGFDNILWMYAPASPDVSPARDQLIAQLPLLTLATHPSSTAPQVYGREKVLERLPDEATVDIIGMDQYTKQAEYREVRFNPREEASSTHLTIYQLTHPNLRLP